MWRDTCLSPAAAVPHGVLAGSPAVGSLWPSCLRAPCPASLLAFDLCSDPVLLCYTGRGSCGKPAVVSKSGEKPQLMPPLQPPLPTSPVLPLSSGPALAPCPSDLVASAHPGLAHLTSWCHPRPASPLEPCLVVCRW